MDYSGITVLVREQRINGRNFWWAAGLGLAADQMAGVMHRQFGMSHEPETETFINPDSNRTIIVAGGMANDGIALARKITPNYLSSLGSVIGVRYAETNIEAEPLVAAIEEAIKTNGLEGNRFDAYLNSAGGIFMAEPLRRLAELQRHIGKVVMDSSPHDAGDVRWPLGKLIDVRFDLLKHSRTMAYFARLASNQVIPPAGVKDTGIPLEHAEDDRDAIVNADTIVIGVQAAKIRQGVPDGLLYDGVADEFVYLRCMGRDTLVKVDRATRGWGQSVRPLTTVVDPYRPADSHAIGGSYPRGLAEVLRGTL